MLVIPVRDGKMGKLAHILVCCFVPIFFISSAQAQVERQPNGTWPATKSKRDTEEVKEAFRAIQAVQSGQVIIRPQDFHFDPELQKDLIYSGSTGKLEIRLQGFGSFPFSFVQPDTAIPLAYPHGPNPFSGAFPQLLVLSECSVEIQVLTEGIGEIGRVLLDGVNRGPYQIELLGGSTQHQIQIWYNGKPVNRALSNVGVRKSLK